MKPFGCYQMLTPRRTSHLTSIKSCVSSGQSVVERLRWKRMSARAQAGHDINDPCMHELQNRCLQPISNQAAGIALAPARPRYTRMRQSQGPLVSFVRDTHTILDICLSIKHVMPYHAGTKISESSTICCGVVTGTLGPISLHRR